MSSNFNHSGKLKRTMKPLFSPKQIFNHFILALLFVVGGAQTLCAGDFVDFLPKYRKYKSHYQIDKIHYRDKRTIIHFRYVVQKSGTTNFYNGSHPNSWYLRTPPRMRGLEIQFKQLELRDISINGVQKLKSLSHVPEISYEVSRGDVVTLEMHFVRIPRYIRMLDLIEGKDGDLDHDNFNCFDILIKTKENPLLGSADNEKQVVARFEKSFNYIKPQKKEPTIASTTQASSTTSRSSLNANRSTSSRSSTTPSRTNSRSTSSTSSPSTSKKKEAVPEPIDYTPPSLTSMNDLKCSERVILADVKFKEGETSFAGRVRAVRNIRVVADYLKAFPKAKVNLYGHTDIYGSKYKNLNLSRERAFAVKRELMKMGIDRDKVKIYFFGGERPLKKYKFGGPANRRVEVQPVCPG